MVAIFGKHSKDANINLPPSHGGLQESDLCVLKSFTARGEMVPSSLGSPSEGGEGVGEGEERSRE